MRIRNLIILKEINLKHIFILLIDQPKNSEIFNKDILQILFSFVSIVIVQNWASTFVLGCFAFNSLSADVARSYAGKLGYMKW